MNTQLKLGDKVHYTPSHGKKENGIVKSIGVIGNAFVVYNCAGDWDNYKNYTGASTNLEDLKIGWVDENGQILPAYCDHYYILDNHKWTPINRRTCQYCGDVQN